MNRRSLFYGFSLSCVLVLMSCASRPAVLPPPPAVETFPAPVRILRPIEQLAQRVKSDDPALTKYFLQAEDSTIAVMADWEGFRVIYNLGGIRPIPGGRWEVDFIVQEAGGGERLADTLIWTIFPGESGVLLSLDDDYLDTWREYFDFFDQYGAKITFLSSAAIRLFVRKPWPGDTTSATTP